MLIENFISQFSISTWTVIRYACIVMLSVLFSPVLLVVSKKGIYVCRRRRYADFGMLPERRECACVYIKIGISWKLLNQTTPYYSHRDNSVINYKVCPHWKFMEWMPASLFVNLFSPPTFCLPLPSSLSISLAFYPEFSPLHSYTFFYIEFQDIYLKLCFLADTSICLLVCCFHANLFDFILNFAPSLSPIKLVDCVRAPGVGYLWGDQILRFQITYGLYLRLFFLTSPTEIILGSAIVTKLFCLELKLSCWSSKIVIFYTYL